MPPLPTSLEDDELDLHLGLQQVAQHNMNASYPKQEQYDEGIQLSNYSSPPEERYAYQGQQPQRYLFQHQQQDSGLGLQYDGYSRDYHGQPMYSDYNTPATSPRTPNMMTHDMRTRNGIYSRPSIRPMPEHQTREVKSPKPPKKAKKIKQKAEKKVAKLDKPLSELTKDWTHVPVVDIESYVNRSSEDRRREVEEGKVPGKVKRPMNSFMLYRKAYQNRTKDWCLQNNHQVVSQVCGDSWPLEPDAVRKQFEEWSRTERINHQNAHPGYKFSPSKPGTVKQSNGNKRRQKTPTSDESDLEDFEWKDHSYRKSKRTRYGQSAAPRYVEDPVAYPTQKSAYSYSDSRGSSLDPSYGGGASRSSYQTNNPGRPVPPQYNQSNLSQGEYYQTSIQANPSFGSGIQDVVMRKAALHAPPQMQPGSYLGLPGGAAIQEFELMQPYTYEQPQGEHRIDPCLLPQAYESASFNGDAANPDMYFGGQSGSRQWQSEYDSGEHDLTMPFVDPELHGEGTNIQHPHTNVLKGHQEGWHAESLDGGGEFDKWMPEDERGMSPP